MDEINRREAVRRAGLLLGGMLSAPAVAGVMSGCRASTTEGWAPAALSAEQNEMVASMAAHIIPATDTPGAREVQVNRFIDKMLAEWYPPADRRQFLAGLDEVNARCQQRYGQAYLACTPEGQFAFLMRLDRQAFGSAEAPGRDEAEKPGAEQPEGEARTAQGGGAVRTGEAVEDARADSMRAASEPTTAPATDDTTFFRRLKELTLLGYYTSEAGMKQELSVNIVPGRYEGCVPLEEVRPSVA